uniref:Uncharacterized protein n=1 Tax=Myotis myotis TaxID=51298 RepID=A0A7J7U5J7_MYOMY|nr:hypothetical protein mMyoMyo1_008870 [Myotis myotis]
MVLGGGGREGPAGTGAAEGVQSRAQFPPEIPSPSSPPSPPRCCPSGAAGRAPGTRHRGGRIQSPRRPQRELKWLLAMCFGVPTWPSLNSRAHPGHPREVRSGVTDPGFFWPGIQVAVPGEWGGGGSAGEHLRQRFSTLWPFKYSSSCGDPTIKLFSLLLHHCNGATVMNRNVNT